MIASFKQEALAAVEEVKSICDKHEQWSVVSAKDDIKIFTTKSIKHVGSEDPYLLVCTLPCKVDKLEKLVSPWLEYRMKWDQMLEGVEVIERCEEEELYLVRHRVKKLYTISARDSIDIVKVVRSGDTVIFGSTSVDLPSYPPSKDFVRTKQYLGGYMMRPSAKDTSQSEFFMLFHADLNLSGPKFLTSLATNLASKFKPKLMKDKIENLKTAIDQHNI